MNADAKRNGYTRLVRYVIPEGRNEWEERPTVLKSAGELRDLVATLWSNSPAEFYDVISPAGDVLRLGLGDNAGCALYGTWLMVKEGRVLLAVGDEDSQDESEPKVAFLSGAGGEPNDVGRRYLLPLGAVQLIASRFFNHADAARAITWE